MTRPVALRRLVRTTGFDVARYPARSTLTGHLKWLIDIHRIDLVLDVGANRGQFVGNLRKEVRFNGRVISFEPTPQAVEALNSAAASDTNWSVVACALGAREGDAQLQTYASSNWNSLRHLDLNSVAESGRSIEPTGSVTCPVRRLDRIWEEVVPAGATVLLKSDTQGGDLDVLMGAGDRLESVTALLVEASIRMFYDNEPTLPDVLAFAADVGFAPSGFFPVARSRGSLALDTIDVCFVRRRSKAV